MKKLKITVKAKSNEELIRALGRVILKITDDFERYDPVDKNIEYEYEITDDS